MWDESAQAFFGLCGLFLIWVAIAKLRRPPERGRPDSMDRYLKYFFSSLLLLTGGLVFTLTSVAALFFGFSLRVASWQQCAQALVLALVLNAVAFAYRRLRERRRARPDA